MFMFCALIDFPCSNLIFRNMAVLSQQATVACRIFLVRVCYSILFSMKSTFYQWIPTSHRDKIFIGCTQAKRQKLFSTPSGFTNASKQISCRPSMLTGLDVKSQAMKGGSFFVIILSLLNPYVTTVSISREVHQGALRNPHLGQSNPFLLKLCKLRYPRLNLCNHTNFRCTLLCKGRLLVRPPGRLR